ncbi:MAG TPA: hypothetical protein VHB73_06995 [Alphaproteobacteria bacterium]|nr:hypothetical protein [Alphaproteobacteria bacterium]
MAALINTVYPSYNNTANYSGVGSAVKSAGAVINPEQYQTVLGLEREGRLGLSQFGLIKLPREVLFLQDERGAKVRGTRQGDQVASSTQSDMDEDRLASKVQDATSTVPGVTQKKKDATQQDIAAQPDAANAETAQDEAASASIATAKTAAKAAEDPVSAFLSQIDNSFEGAKTARRNEREKDRKEQSFVPSVLGKGSSVYRGVASAPNAGLAGRHISVLA